MGFILYLFRATTAWIKKKNLDFILYHMDSKFHQALKAVPGPPRWPPTRTHHHPASGHAAGLLNLPFCCSSASKGCPQVTVSIPSPCVEPGPWPSTVQCACEASSLGTTLGPDSRQVPRGIWLSVCRLRPELRPSSGSLPFPVLLPSSLLNKELSTDPCLGESWSQGLLLGNWSLNTLQAGELAFPPGRCLCPIVMLLPSQVPSCPLALCLGQGA